MTPARTTIKCTPEYNVFTFRGSKKETRGFYRFLFYTFLIARVEQAVHLRSGKIIHAHPTIPKGNEDSRKVYVQFKSKNVTKVYTLEEGSIIATMPVEVGKFEF